MTLFLMPNNEVTESVKIVNLAAQLLLGTASKPTGRTGSDLRRMCGDIIANAETYIVTNVIGQKLSDCFAQARLTGATMDQFNRIQENLGAEQVVTLTATMLQQVCISFGLQQMSIAATATTFTSRDDVDAAVVDINAAFNPAEENAADAMVLIVYRALISLHAAVTYYLYQTAQPLPQMLSFQFAVTKPTLIQSYRLYADASRADELRAENKVVHPAFSPRTGRALSF